jgi:hypothetical protein
MDGEGKSLQTLSVAPHGAHKVSESSVYGLVTYMTAPTEIDHPTAEPALDAHCQRLQAAGEENTRRICFALLRPAEHVLRAF